MKSLIKSLIKSLTKWTQWARSLRPNESARASQGIHRPSQEFLWRIPVGIIILLSVSPIFTKISVKLLSSPWNEFIPIGQHLDQDPDNTSRRGSKTTCLQTHQHLFVNAKYHVWDEYLLYASRPSLPETSGNHHNETHPLKSMALLKEEPPLLEVFQQKYYLGI